MKEFKVSGIYGHVWDGITQGKFNEISKCGIEKIVEEHYLGFEPLTPTMQPERDALKSYLTRFLYGKLNQTFFKAIASNDIRFLPGDSFNEPNKPTFYFDCKTPSQAKSLSAEEKREILMNPDTWVYDNMNVKNMSYGLGWAYLSGNHELGSEFLQNQKKILDETRKRTGRKNLKVLDIGSGVNGLLFILKKLDNDVETHGLVADPEPSTFKVDYQHHLTAECFPKEFGGYFDYICSNAFRHILFTHMALDNAIASLNKGGHAVLNGICADQFMHITDGNPELEKYFAEQRNFLKLEKSKTRDDYLVAEHRMKKAHEKLAYMKDKGIIEYDFEEYNSGGFDGTLRITKLRDE